MWSRIDIEVNSLVLANLVQSKCAVPWSIAYDFRALMFLLRQCNYSISHTFREDNMAADCLSNIGCKEGRRLMFTNSNVPHKLRGILRIGRSGLANLRRRRV